MKNIILGIVILAATGLYFYPSKISVPFERLGKNEVKREMTVKEKELHAKITKDKMERKTVEEIINLANAKIKARGTGIKIDPTNQETFLKSLLEN